MDPFMLFAAGVTLLGVVGDYQMYKESKSQAARVEEIARENARLQRMEAEETERRMRKEQEKQRSLTRARAAASGYRESKSAQIYLSEMTKEHETEIEWIRMSSEMRQNIMIQEAAMEADAIRAQGKTSLWNAVGRTATALFYAREAGLFSTKSDLLRDAQNLAGQEYWTTPDSRYGINNPFAPSTYSVPTILG